MRKIIVAEHDKAGHTVKVREYKSNKSALHGIQRIKLKRGHTLLPYYD